MARKPNTSYGYEVRLQVLTMHRSGVSSTRISRATGIDSSVIRRWLRRYSMYGAQSLQPYWRADSPLKTSQASVFKDKDRRYSSAFTAYATTQESVASIARRFGLEYHSFRYHILRHHPELVEQRRKLKERSIG